MAPMVQLKPLYLKIAGHALNNVVPSIQLIFHFLPIPLSLSLSLSLSSFAHTGQFSLSFSHFRILTFAFEVQEISGVCRYILV